MSENENNLETGRADVDDTSVQDALELENDGQLADELLKLHPADLSDGVEQLSPEQREDLIARAPEVFSGDVLAEMEDDVCLLYTSPSPRDRTRSRMPSSA